MKNRTPARRAGVFFWAKSNLLAKQWAIALIALPAAIYHSRRGIGKTKRLVFYRVESSVMLMRSRANQKTLQARRRELVVHYAKLLLKAANKYFAKQSLVPTGPVLDTAVFPWVAELERNWEAIRSEALRVLEDRESLPFFQDISPDQGRISPDDKWRTFFFRGFGSPSEPNCEACPQTASLLEQVPGLETAFFSILAPGKVIPVHTGRITKGLVRGHLGIVIPTAAAECFMDVGDVRCTWSEGKVLLFDDTYPHGVSNMTDQERVVLLFDFHRPMRWPGRLFRTLVFWAGRRTAYVQDALRNEARWTRNYYGRSQVTAPEPRMAAGS
jgi:ornithine lipid ester-linked acyl 2-hydroxylase